MPATVRKKTPRKPFPHPPDLPDVASVFEVELSRLGATRAKGTLADRLRALDWLEEQPVRIVESLLLAPYFETFAETWRDNEERVAQAAEGALRALDTLIRALSESGARIVIVDCETKADEADKPPPLMDASTSIVPEVPEGRQGLALLAQARNLTKRLGVPSRPQGRPSKRRDSGNAGRVAVALEVLARAGLAGVPRRTIFEAKDPIRAWAKEAALSLCGPDPDFRKRRAETLDQLESAFEERTLPLPGNLGVVFHPVLIPAIRETLNTS